MLRKKRIQIKNLVTGLIEYLDFKSLQKQLDSVAEYTGGNVKTTPVGEVLSSDVDSAITELETNKQKTISFYNNGVLLGQGHEFNAGSGTSLDLVGDRVTVTAGATVESLNFGSDLFINNTPSQYYNLTPTNPSLVVTLSQPSADAVTNIYNTSNTEPFTVEVNWEGDPYYNNTNLLIVGETVIEDASPTPKTLSVNGSVALSTEQVRYETESIKFNGPGDYISVGTVSDFTHYHSDVDWTLDFWAYLTSTTGTLIYTATGDTQKGISILSDGTINIYNGTAGQAIFSGSFTPPPLNTYNHYEFTHSSTLNELYVRINGSLAQTLSQIDAYTTGDSGFPLIIGNQVTGYLEALRDTLAIRNIGDFTPETSAPFTYQRVGTYFTQPVIPGISAKFTFDPTKGWMLPFVLPQFEFQEEGVDVASVGEITKINYTGVGITTSLTDTVLTVDVDAISSAEKGAINGVATLDSNGFITSSQIPASLYIYKGGWDASTNTPTLIDGTGDAGETYDVTVAGTQDLGSGNLTFQINDSIRYDGAKWIKLDNIDQVTSVFSRTGIITAQSGDYTASQVTNTPSGNISSTDIQAAINELDTEKQADIQWQDDGVNQGTAGQASIVNVTGAGASLSISSGTATLNIPGLGTVPTLTLQEQGSAPTPGVNEATVYIDASQILRYREESSGTINQVAVLGRTQTYTAAQGTAQVTLTDATNISVNAALSNSFTVTLGGNRTLDNPTNTVAGFTYIFRIVQDATGSRTLAYGTNYKFPGGTVPTLSTTANAVDILTCYCGISNGNLNCTLTKDFK